MTTRDLKTIEEHLIETASELFYKQGYSLTGINEVIKEAGIAKATLYNYYKSKDALCVEYLRFMGDQFMIDLEEYVYNHPRGRRQVLSFFDFLTEFCTSDDFHGDWCVNTNAQILKDNVLVIEEIQQQKSNLFTFIKQVISENLVDPSEEDVVNLTRKVYLLFDGAMVESWLVNSNWPIETAKEMCGQIL